MSTPTANEQLLRINVFRPIDGLRTPCVIVLDRQRNVIDEFVDEEQLKIIKSTPHLLARHMLEPARPDPKLMQQQTGLNRHVTDKAIVLSREPLDEWAQQFVQWLDSSQRNPFPDSHDLRLEYFADRADVERRIAEGNCPGCELNRLEIEYRVKLRKLLGIA